jgi:hypothetical protein
MCVLESLKVSIFSKQVIRRIFSVLLVIIGVVMIFLATAKAGILLMIIGVSIEAIAIAIRRK